MARRHADWLAQAERNLQMARTLLGDRLYEGSCFHSQQAAELAAKALLESRGRAEPGHDVRRLLQAVGVENEDVLEVAGVLDRYYIASRYPSAFSQGAPADHYYHRDATEALGFAERIIEFVKAQIGGL